MTPQEVIDGCVEQANQNVEELYKAQIADVQGFGIVQPFSPGVVWRESKTPLYKHCIVITKKYRDAGSAAFHLIRAIECINGAKKLFWRYPPEIVWNHDFGIRYPVCVGRVRFSIQ